MDKNSKFITSILNNKLDINPLIIRIPNENHYMVFVNGNGKDFKYQYNQVVKTLINTGIFKTGKFPDAEYNFSVYINNKITSLKKRHLQIK